MKKLLTVYGISLLALLIVSVAGIRLSQVSGARGALRKLGRGEREYQEARQALLLGAGDPADEVIAFVNDAQKPLRARMHALTILGEMCFQRPMVNQGDRISPLLYAEAPEMQLKILEALAEFGGAGGAYDVARLFATTSDSVLFQQSFETMKAMLHPQIYRPEGVSVHSLGTYILKKMLDGDSVAVDSCARIIDSLPVGKGRILPHYAFWHKNRGEFSKAASYIQRMGIIDTWWVIGGWDNQKMASFYKVFPPETAAFNHGQRFPLSDSATARWFPLRKTLDGGNRDSYGSIDLRKLMVKQLYSIAYLFTYVHSDKDQEALLFLGSDDGVRVWLNGELVWTNKTYRGTLLDDDVAKVRIIKGVNRLLIKVAQDVGGWGCVARLTDYDGEALDVRASLSETSDENRSAKLIALIENGDRRWREALDSLGAGNDALAEALCAKAVSEAAPLSVRKDALEALRKVNAQRMAPAGERMLIAAAEKSLPIEAAREYTADLFKTLAAMRSVKCLDLGLAARSIDSGSVRVYGEMLIGRWCRDRIMRAGVYSKDELSGSVRRAFSDVQSLNPRDAWLFERIARFHLASEDSAAAEPYLNRIAMPERWLMQSGIKVDEQQLPGVIEQARSALHAQPHLFDSAWSALGDRAGPMHKIRASETGGYLHGAIVHLTTGKGWQSGDHYTMLITNFTSEYEVDMYMAITVGSAYHAFLNWEKAGSGAVDDVAAVSLREWYPQQEINFDAKLHRVKVRRGANTVVLMVHNSWHPQVWPKTVRCAFVAMDGTVPGFDGQKLRGAGANNQHASVEPND